MEPSIKDFSFSFNHAEWKSSLEHQPTTSTDHQPITTSGKYAHWTREELIMEFYPEVVFSVHD